MEQTFEINAVLYGAEDASDLDIERAADWAFAGTCIDIDIDRSESNPRIRIEGTKAVHYLPDDDMFDDLEDTGTLSDRLTRLCAGLNDDGFDTDSDILDIFCESEDQMYRHLREDEETQWMNEQEAQAMERMCIGA